MKTLLWLILSLVLLVGIGMAVFVATFDPNSYRELLGKTVERSTGRRLAIGGDLSLTVWPNIALRAEQLSLANADNFDPEPMITAEALEATIALAPLLQREVNIDGVALHSPVIALMEKPTGETNWSDLQARIDTTTADKVDTDSATQADAKTAIELNSVVLTNATITFKSPDQQISLQALDAKVDFAASGMLSLTTSGGLQADSQSAPADFSLSTNYSANAETNLLKQTQLTLALGANEQLQLSIPDINLGTDLQELRIDEGSATLANSTLNFSATVTDLQTAQSFEANITTTEADTQALLALADLELPATVPAGQLGTLDVQAKLSGALTGSSGGAISVPAFTAKLRGLELEVAGRMELAANGTAQGNLRLAPLDLSRLARALPELLDPDLFQTQSPPDNPATLEALQTEFAWIPAELSPAKPATLNFSNARIEALGLGATLSGTGRLTTPGTTLSSTIRVDEFSPKQALTYFTAPITTEDSSALTSASGALTLHQDATGTHLRDLAVSVDKSQLNGTISLLQAPIPTLRFDVALDRLNASSYLAPTEQSAPTDETADVLGDLVLPTALLHSYDLDGSFRINQLVLFDLQLGDAGSRVILGDGRAALNNLSARLYGGSFIGKVGFVEGDTKPELAITGDLQRVDIASLMQAISNTHDFTGRGNVQINMTGRGATALAAVQSAAGSFGLQLEEGTYTGINIGHELCRLYNRLRNKPAPPQASDPTTTFDTFSATANVSAGLAQTDDLLASNSYLKISGQGTTQLAQQSIKYDLDIELTGPIEETNCETLTPYVGSRIPVRLTGNFANPTLRPDFGKLAKREIRRRVEEKLTDKLLDIFGGKKADKEPEPQEDPG